MHCELEFYKNNIQICRTVKIIRHIEKYVFYRHIIKISEESPTAFLILNFVRITCDNTELYFLHDENSQSLEKLNLTSEIL